MYRLRPLLLLIPVLATGHVVTAVAGVSAPRPATVSPAELVENGKPMVLVITGQNLSGVNAVVLAPTNPPHTFTILNDDVIQVVLPATTAPATYTVRVLSPGAGSDPTQDLTVLVATPAPPPAAVVAPVRPKYTFDPAPGLGSQASATSDPPPASVRTSSAPPATRPVGPGGLPTLPFEPAMIVLAGLLAGALGYALWGSAGRLATVRRTGLLVQVIGRPGQRLRLAHVCPGCTRLHWRWATRTDLWRAGDYCSVACLVDHGDELIEACYSDDVASSRLHLMARLEAVLEAEAAEATDARAPYLPLLLNELMAQLEAVLEAETVESADARAAYLPRLLHDLDQTEPEQRLTGQPMAALLPVTELIPLPPAASG